MIPVPITPTLSPWFLVMFYNRDRPSEPDLTSVYCLTRPASAAREERVTRFTQIKEAVPSQQACRRLENHNTVPEPLAWPRERPCRS